MTVVGQRVRAIGWEKRTAGTDAYTADLPIEGVIAGRIVRSPHPYAQIVSIDTSRAEKMPGVRAVITAKDFPPGARYIHSGGETSDRGPLADGVVRYVGEEVAAVAADTEEQADAACDAVVVRYHDQDGKHVADSVMVRAAKKAAETPKAETPKKDETKK